MKKSLRFFSGLLLFKGLLFFTGAVFGQKIILQETTQMGSHSSDHNHNDKCAHTILESKLEKEMGYFGSKDFFENWIDQKIETNRRSPQIARTQDGRRLIPVVVHVLHNGTPVGTGTNVPDSQIFEQIRILNEDFRRLNADASRTPAEFLPVAADSNIEFVLAKQDPNGLPTTGIVRLQGPKTIYNPNTDPVLIGTTSQWNPEEYLNLWVVPLVSPFIGYASFPVSDLPGLNFSPTPVITDGVTIDYRFLGRGGSASTASLGRTATHEVGHYLGLRHIWGDGGCEVDDFVTDTPNQDNPNTVCNANPSRFSCGNNNMIQNYMDYTPDACMNLFTLGQLERFNVVLENSPRRVTLVNNRATQDPVLINRDLSITRIINPEDAICDLTIVPQIEVQNTGSETLTSAQIEFAVNGLLVESRRFTLNLTTGQLASLTFNPTLLPGTSNKLDFKITQVNGLSDERPENNSKSANPILQGEIALPYTYDINTFPGQWVIRNPDASFTWQKTNLTISGTLQPAVLIRHYEYEAAGQVDYLISPIIDLAKYPNAQLVFEVAHAPYNQAGFQDKLIVSVAEDCGSNFDLVNAPYLKSGTRLETSSPTLNEFIPTTDSQFRTELVNLSKFQSLGKVRLTIATENAFGNNIYIRNIRILPQEEFKYELRIDEIVSPTPISDGEQTQEVVKITNTGNLPVSKFLFSRTTNAAATQTYIGSGTTITPGEQVDLEINSSTTDGKNRLAFSIFNPNFDQNGSTPVLFERFNIEATTTTPIPWRQNFNSSTDLAPWLTINPEKDEAGWTISPSSNGTGLNNIAKIENGKAGFSYWLGSPVFDLSKSRQASIFFDLASGQVNPATRLLVLASSDGGQTYTQVWSATGPELSTVNVGAANPNSPGDFQRKYINLTEFAGAESSQVRLAFVLKLAGTANTPVYLDNLELFLSANPEPVIPGEGSSILYPNPAREFFNLAFNLRSRETVTIQIVSATGAILQEIEYPGTLNQTYTFSTDLFRPGVYIIQISSNSIQDLKRLIIN
jgi:hypothetical protein